MALNLQLVTGVKFQYLKDEIKLSIVIILKECAWSTRPCKKKAKWKKCETYIWQTQQPDSIL